MKTFTFFFAILLLTVSCTSNTSKDQLLTATSWTIDPASTNGDTTPEVINFAKDGSYSLEAGTLKVTGKWSWKGEDEILLMVQGLTSDNGEATFEKTSNYNIRVVDISDDALKILEKGEGDTWESGAAKEKKFLAKK